MEIIGLVLWVLFVYAAYKLAETNEMSQVGWTIGAALFGAVSLVVQIIVLAFSDSDQ